MRIYRALHAHIVYAEMCDWMKETKSSSDFDVCIFEHITLRTRYICTLYMTHDTIFFRRLSRSKKKVLLRCLSFDFGIFVDLYQNEFTQNSCSSLESQPPIISNEFF